MDAYADDEREGLRSLRLRPQIGLQPAGCGRGTGLRGLAALVQAAWALVMTARSLPNAQS